MHGVGFAAVMTSVSPLRRNWASVHDVGFAAVMALPESSPQPYLHHVVACEPAATASHGPHHLYKG